MSSPSNLRLARPPFPLDTDLLDQHLTVAPAVVDALIRAAELRCTDIALEIGAGTGLITRVLARRVRKTVVVELDRRFERYLEPLRHIDGITVQWSDFRRLAPSHVTVVVANPPFGSTEHLVDWLTKLPRLRRAALIVGRRFALAATALPGAAAYTRLSLHLQAAFNAEIAATAAPTAFYPPARTAAAILALTPSKADPLREALDRAFTATAGMLLGDLIESLQRRGLISGHSPLQRHRLLLRSRLQQLTNAHVSDLVRTLLSSPEGRI
ncbi:MAG: hypothetical protein J2P17_28485 [Mycobacterium sp.]|nr:hypothetical protein [Mycobacterium sp.]